MLDVNEFRTFTGVDGDLSVFHQPRNIVVVGASASVEKWGYWMARGALKGADVRPGYLVNPRTPEVAGVATYATMAELPEAPDLVVLCTPGSSVPGLVDEAIALGARGFLCITADVGDVQTKMASDIRAKGARLLGPNAMGLFDQASSLKMVWGDLSPGRVAIVTQSGGIALELSALLARRGLGISRMVSLGNQVDVTGYEELDGLAGRQDTNLVVVYLEDFRDGERILKAMTRLHESGQRVVVISTGRSAGAQATVRSHTGAITSQSEVVDAACRAAGAITVATPSAAANVASVMGGSGSVRGRRVAVVSDGGGQAAIAADVLEQLSLHVNPFSPSLAHAVGQVLPIQAALSNPVDLAGAGEQDIFNFARVIGLICESGEVDCLVLTGYFANYCIDVPSLRDNEFEVARQLGEIARRTGVAIVVQTYSPESATAMVLREAGVATFGVIEDAASALDYAAMFAEVAPRPRAGLTSDVPLEASSRTEFSYWSSRQLLSDHAITFPQAVLIDSNGALERVADQLTFPVALKADWIAHKSDVGGLVLNIQSADELRRVHASMVEKLGNGSFVAEEMDTRPDIVECIVSVRRDALFGAVVTLGLGGANVEIFQDVAHELAPVSSDEATAMLTRVRSSVLLGEWRGRGARDVDALTSLVERLSRLIFTLEGVREIELNPVRVGRGGVLVVDALVLGNSIV